MNKTPFHLHGKTIFISGASSGIGRQIAISVSQMGGRVVITGRNQDRLDETFKSLSGSGHLTVLGDLTDTNQRDNIIKQLPQLDGVVMNAGMVQAYPIKFMTLEKIKETFSINYDAVVLLIAGITRNKKLNKGASVVFISSISSNFPPKGGSMYSSAKAAIESFSKVLALEHYTQKIRSNCILPGMVKTALYEDVEKVITKESLDAHVAKYPLGVGYPEDVANTAIFLLSDASRWITGTNLIIDGGCILNA
ncbi:MAG: SDR family oxidoreductase [Flavobacteriales bacterium]|nr:SDR family oxidoreductase [Flavobacteriales bacterium]HRP58689.1 SDR family oxidoreductase [Vicingus sp.]